MKFIRTILFIIILNCLMNGFTLIAGKLPDPKTAQVTLTVKDIYNTPVKGARIQITCEDYTNSGETGPKGIYSAKLPKGKIYDVFIKKYGSKFNFKELIEIPDTIERVFINQPIKISVVKKYIRRYVLQGVFFYLNKDTLKQISFKALDELVKKMEETPGMHIEVAGHTDDTGKPAHNMRLSQKRAEAVKRYLIKKGINKKRIEA
ncbi:MAG: OmpA family protein, partial [Spirochaetes bacterium]|nr:OmpA family protein [Spirochaetota bacterium]